MPVELKPYALTTKERLQFLGGAPSGLHDDEYNFSINLVSREIEKLCGRQLYQVTHTAEDPERHEGNGGLRLYLRSYPIVSITSVKVNSVAVTDFRDSKKDRERGFIYCEGRWPMLVGVYADLTRDPYFSNKEHIEVAYVGGYKTPAQGDAAAGEFELPEDLEGCVFREVSDLVSGGRVSGRIKSERTPGGAGVVYDLSGPIVLSKETLECLSSGGYVAPWVV